MKRTTVAKRTIEEMVSDLITVKLENHLHSKFQSEARKLRKARSKTREEVRALPAPSTEEDEVIEAETVEEEEVPTTSPLSFRKKDPLA